MNYKAGDSIICIDAILTGLVAGARYVCAGFHPCLVTGETFTLISGKRARNPLVCLKCGAVDHHVYYHSWRFIKLDPFALEEQEEGLRIIKHELETDNARQPD